MRHLTNKSLDLFSKRSLVERNGKKSVRGLLAPALLVSTFAIPLVIAAHAQTTKSGVPTKTETSKAGDANSALSPEKIEFFEKKVRPLLIENCFGCHGPNGEAKGNLHLDSRAGLLKGGDRGTAINASNPQESVLLAAVRYTDPHLQMPPKGRLPEEQIATLTEWVKMGAPFPQKKTPTRSTVTAPSAFDIKPRLKHWAWQPVKTPTLPTVKNATWARNPIDRFILTKLEEKGLKPAPSADRRTLIRRVTYDLIGLPPTPAEVADFLADRSPNAYEKVVDRLLASPHYGERWARHWLDLVRYAETRGHEWDFEATGAWQYRDYLIRAINADVPYNQFVLEHLAGDLLPQPRRNPKDQFNESILGTGFFWLGAGKHSPVDLRDDEAERIDNQIDVLGKAFQGVTVGCARCHDHKFDAISSKDYYALFGFLKSSRQQLVSVAPPLSPKLRKDLTDSHAELQRTLLHAAGTSLAQGVDLQSPASDRIQAALKEAANRPSHPLYAWTKLTAPDATRSPETFRSVRDNIHRELVARNEQSQKDFRSIRWMLGPEAATDANSSWYPAGEAAERLAGNGLVLRFDTNKRDRILAAFPAVANSGGISDRLQGSYRSATFTIEKKHLVYQVMGKEARVRLIIDGYQLIQDPLYGRLQFDVNNADKPEWRVQDVSTWVGHRAYIELVDNGGGYISVARIGATDDGAPTEPVNPQVLHLLDAADTPEALKSGYATLFRNTGNWLLADRLATQAGSNDYHALLNDILPMLTLPADAPTTIASLLEKHGKLDGQVPGIQLALCTADGTGENERIHLRGNYRTLGAEVPRRFMEACGGSPLPAPDEGSGRLKLAQRIASATNPLTARVFVNRIWLHHFGEGIVRTPDDFGVMGQAPTHPELLDWLASNFTASETGAKSPYACGWSLKKLHRLMVLSNTYRMDSRVDEKAELTDPQNRLLHRMPVRRLEAEAIRDSILAVSGRLDPNLYGPSIMPNLNAFLVGRGAPASGPLDGAGRRSIYLSIRRNFPIPLFTAFDYPVPTTTIGRRGVSSVPAQALTLLNDPFIIGQANFWAKRVLEDKSYHNAEERIDGLYATAFSRPPTDGERKAALDFLKLQGEGKPDDLRSWSDLCHVLYNVKEFIFVK